MLLVSKPKRNAKGGGSLWTRRPFALAGVALLGACGPSDNDPGPGAVTVDEARALDEAAEMLEERRIPADVLNKEDDREPDTDQKDAAE